MEENKEVLEEVSETSKEEEIEFRLSEINVLIDQYQTELYDHDNEIMTKEEYNDLTLEQKQLKTELKALRKTTRNSFWDKVKLWQIIYGIVQFAICCPYIGFIYQLCMLVYSKLYDWFGDVLYNVSDNFAFFLEIVMLLAFPILNIFVSWIIYANFVSKKKLDQVVFISIWSGQIVLTIASMLTVFLG